MKRARAIVLILAVAGFANGLQAQTAPADPKPGQTEKQVVEMLGKPRGRIGSADKAFLFYPRGRVVVSNGVVVEVDFLPPAEFQAREARRAAAEAEAQARRDRDNAALRLFLDEPAYQALSTRDRMFALERFQVEHPGAQIYEIYQGLRAIYLQELAAREDAARLQRELAEARERAESAEKSATAAQQQTQRLQQTAQAAPYGQFVGYYTPPVVYPYSPPVTVVTINNGQATVVTSGSQAYCPPVLRPAAISGLTLAVNAGSFQLRYGSSVDVARANLWFNPARRLN